MDEERFDTLTRSFTAAGSRRRALALALSGALGAVLGAAWVEEAAAKKKRKKKPCPPCKKRKKGRCKGKKPDGTACAGGVCCGGTCVDTRRNASHCGGCDSACGAGQLCAQSQCVTGQGSCAAGADACLNSSAKCGASGTCYSFTTMDNQTRCGGSNLSSCGACTSDAQCETLHPTTPGAFCVKDTGAVCGCTLGQGICVRPCPD